MKEYILHQLRQSNKYVYEKDSDSLVYFDKILT
jgi:hypothetical protein